MPPEESMPIASVRDRSALYIPGAIVIAGIIIGGGLFLGLSRGGASTVAPGGAQPSVNIKNVKQDGEPSLGKTNAPVTMAYWFDYQCPFCKQFETSVLPTLVTKYVNSGKLRIVFKDFAFLGNDSTTAALYEHAIWDLYPDKFFAWQEAMFKAQDEEGDRGFGNEQSILALIAKIPGVDAQKVKAQVAAKKDAYQKISDANRDEGAKFGIQGTPGFIIGTVSIDGARPIADFISAIDSQLK